MASLAFVWEVNVPPFCSDCTALQIGILGHGKCRHGKFITFLTYTICNECYTPPVFLKYVCDEGYVLHASGVLYVLSGKCPSNPGWSNSSPLQCNGRPPEGGKIPAAIRSRHHDQRQGRIESSHPSYGRSTTVETC